MVYIRFMKAYYLLFVFVIFSSSCAVRKANRIEYLFLENYMRDTVGGKTPSSYSVSTSYQEGGTSTNMSSGHTTHHIGTYIVQVEIRDTLNDNSYALDDPALLQLAKNNPNCLKYIKKYERQKTMKRVHRYGSLASMAGGITMLALSGGDDATSTSAQKKLGNAGGYILTAGFLNWIGGGINRALQRRLTLMKTAYVYQFGSLPAYLPPISKKAKYALLKANPAFRNKLR
jgi:hypothetical protein